MKTIIFVILLFIPINSFCDIIKTDKVDPDKTKIIIDELTELYNKNKQDSYSIITKNFSNNYSLYVFYTPDLQGSINVYVLNNNKEIILEKNIGMTQDEPDFNYKINENSVLITYQTRIERGVGPGLSESIFERRVEIYNGKQNTIFKIMGDIEAHNHGEEKAAYSSYFDQKNDCILNNGEIVLKYKYAYWEDTGKYKNEEFIQKIKPDEKRELSVYLNIENDDIIFNKKKSDEFTESQINLFMISFEGFNKDHYKKEMIKY